MHFVTRFHRNHGDLKPQYQFINFQKLILIILRPYMWYDSVSLKWTLELFTSYKTFFYFYRVSINEKFTKVWKYFEGFETPSKSFLKFDFLFYIKFTIFGFWLNIRFESSQLYLDRVREVQWGPDIDSD